jgi:hypothetical protein
MMAHCGDFNRIVYVRKGVACWMDGNNDADEEKNCDGMFDVFAGVGNKGKRLS